MKTIDLSKGYVTTVDDADYEWLSNFSWHVVIGRGNDIYARRSQPSLERPGKYECLWMHREILNLEDPSLFTDHIDGDTLNNTRRNLRVVTKQQNSFNMSGRSACGVKGVTFNKRMLRKPWMAHIRVDGVSHNLGYFETIEEAAKARWKAEDDVQGKYSARLSRGV